MRHTLTLFIALTSFTSYGQYATVPNIELLYTVPHTTVKDQGKTGTCWSFSTVSLIESQLLAKGWQEADLSEMFIVRNIYKEKARNYVYRQGAAQFGQGSLGHDVINAIEKYGVVPEDVYSGTLNKTSVHNHEVLERKLKAYLDSILSKRPIPQDWQKSFDAILDEQLGKVPSTFSYKGKTYSPITFAREVLKFSKEDFVKITSFTHHPFYESFVVEVPDNFSNERYFNIPLAEMMQVMEEAIKKGHSVMWDADVSNSGFQPAKGYAIEPVSQVSDKAPSEQEEKKYTQEMRQALFENLTTQDDHLMHIVGLAKSSSGKKYFLVKNSWGQKGNHKGFFYASEPYVAINTITIILSKEALTTELKEKLLKAD